MARHLGTGDQYALLAHPEVKKRRCAALVNKAVEPRLRQPGHLVHRYIQLRLAELQSAVANPLCSAAVILHDQPEPFER